MLAITVVIQDGLMETPRAALILVVASVAQLAVADAWPPTSAGFVPWEHLISR